MPESPIVVHPSAAENGMANMVADLMRENIASSWYKTFCFKLLKGVVGLVVTDAEVSATLVFNRGSCVIYDGLQGNADVTIETSSDSLLELSTIRIIAGLPFYLDSTGMGILAKSVGGEVKIRGMVCHPITLTRLTIVLSVN